MSKRGRFGILIRWTGKVSLRKGCSVKNERNRELANVLGGKCLRQKKEQEECNGPGLCKQ